jgi:hypothetical protein
MPYSLTRPELAAKSIEVQAIVYYNRGYQVEIKDIIFDNIQLKFKDLTSDLQGKLLEELRLAEIARRNYGTIHCPHNKYLVREFCKDCYISKLAK